MMPRYVSPVLAVTMIAAQSLHCPTARAADDDLAEMKRAIEELRAENRALARRVMTLEAEKKASTPAPAASQPGTPAEDPEALARRVRELEIAKAAQEDATRAIIRDSLATTGSRINDAVSLGGALEVLAGRERDFSGESRSSLLLNTAELDFEIRTNDWSSAKLVLEYVTESDSQFPTTSGTDSGVDRVNVDTASISIGDLQRFPIALEAGRMNLDFGSSTGVHRTDVLSIESPLTTEAFEMRRNAVGLSFAWPTPAVARPAPPIVAPPVRPLVLAPLVETLSHAFGYVSPPARPKPLSASSPPPAEPPLYGSLFVYEGDQSHGQRSFTRNLNGRLGYRSSGHCGRNYDELRQSFFCPWSLDLSVDYIGSIFDSRFLASQYQPFRAQFGPVPGMASTLKLGFGPMSMNAEWNGAIDHAVFDDDVGHRWRIAPSAWQVSLGYQFDWNPWVETIGAQGTYAAIGYSQSRDLAGATHVLDDENVRIGAVPKSRLLLTFGEWLAEGLKIAAEYSRITDYTPAEGGTGSTGDGLLMTLTYTW